MKAHRISRVRRRRRTAREMRRELKLPRKAATQDDGENQAKHERTKGAEII